ncbi:protein TRI1-like [Ctenocephalides felis]|uniref:protein TRI1-like n=1 Tax=Ctenocephalides felis TaxID=7515 RepID=UPI000E6E3C8D|nr:protein TRI1-like [Ctenocephalides felis]
MGSRRHTRREAKSRTNSSTTLSEVLINEAKKKRAPRNSGIHKRYRLSPELAKLIGSNEPETRYNVVKLIWIQIKERKLQDPEDPAYIDCDEEFESVTGMVRLKGFTIMKYLNSHFWNR